MSSNIIIYRIEVKKVDLNTMNSQREEVET